MIYGHWAEMLNFNYFPDIYFKHVYQVFFFSDILTPNQHLMPFQ